MGKQVSSLRVLIADHEPEVRQALRLVCEESLGLIVTAEAADGEELLTLLEITHPDILMVEWELPGMQFTDLKNIHPKVVAIAKQLEARTQALKYSDGFVYKGAPPHELITLLRTFIGS
jgi:DNA-binding NarL/FixJ family response regulator